VILEQSDINEYMDDANRNELDRIIRYACELGGENVNLRHFKNQKDGTYVQSEKRELLSRAFDKYTLEELEHRLGSKWDLI
jgi:hypothetical protein